MHIAIENQYAPIRNVSYPAVTVCSPKQVTLSAVEHSERTLVDGNMTIDMKNFLPRLLGFYELFGNNNTQELIKFQNLLSLNRYNALQVLSLLPQRCDDFLRLCYVGGHRYPNCKGLFRPILTKHGMCCIFNSVYQYDDKSFRNERVSHFVPHKAATGGIFDGLTVVTDYDPASALTGTLLIAGAIRTMFTASHEFPADDETSLVHAYSESFHSIHATYTYCSEDVIALPYGSRQCYFEDERYLPHFGRYHNSDCDLLCVVHSIERLCRCTMPYLPYVRLSRACNVSNIDCIVQANKDLNKWHNTETCVCLRDCVSMRYQVDVTIGNLMALPHMIHNPYSGLQFNKSTSALNFFCNTVHVTQKQETVTSLITISSNLGGVFGLCVGCSMISVLEIIFYTYCAIRNKIREHLRGRKNKVDFIPPKSAKKKKMKNFRNFDSKIFNITPIDKEYYLRE
ncbi:sodium channel protein Nach-like isoform X2 [Maniola hyperantus]|uniref:sodium channel protein Nach-like isoform X2 n=1 Tax=Aphantopus hyperantus TaxID=2795564 RepID=UPI003748B199